MIKMKLKLNKHIYRNSRFIGIFSPVGDHNTSLHSSHKIRSILNSSVNCFNVRFMQGLLCKYIEALYRTKHIICEKNSQLLIKNVLF